MAKKGPKSERPQTNPKEEEISRLRARKSELVGEISGLEETSTKAADSVDEYASKATIEYNSDAAALKKYALALESSTIRSLQTAANKSRTVVESVLSYFMLYLLVVLGVLLSIGAIAGYFFITYLTSEEGYFFGSWIIVSAIILGDMFYIRRRLSKSPGELNANLEIQTRQILDAASTKPTSTHDLEPLKQLSRAAKDGVKGVVTRTAELLLTGENILTHENKARRQEHFIDDFIFATKRYNLDISDETKQVMTTKSWLLDDLAGWLKDVSNEMAQVLKVDPRIFQLIYYEFFDSKYADVIWAEIKPSDEVRLQISRLLVQRKLVVIPNQSNPEQIVSELLSGLTTYSLTEAENRVAEFFSNLNEFKLACISHLDYYGLRVVKEKEGLVQWIPSTTDSTTWRDDVVEHIAQKIISKSTQNIKLLVWSSEGDQGTAALWSGIRESGNLKELADILGIKRIRPKFSSFNNETFVAHLALVLGRPDIDFDLADIQSTLDVLEREMITTKYRLQHTITEFRLKQVGLDSIDNYVPSSPTEVEKVIVSSFSGPLGVDSEILWLLYCTSNGLQNAQDLFQKLARTEKAGGITKLLFDNNIITKGRFSVNAVSLLQAQTEFSVNGFVSTYVRYETLFESLENLYPFLDANHILERSTPLGFEEVLKICPLTDLSSLEIRLERLARGLVRSVFDGTVLDQDYLSDLSLASTAIYMRTHGYSGYAQLCQLASRREFAPKVMFQYISLVTEESLSGGVGGLEGAVVRALKGVEDISNYNYFKTELQDGKLAPSAQLLYSQLRKEIKSAYAGLETKGFEKKTLTNYLNPIKDLLYDMLNEKVVREFLLTQVLSAYLLTVPGAVPGITFIETGDQQYARLKYIRLAEASLSETKKDPIYSNMIQLSTGGGKATRIGLVPFELGFDEFATRFDEVWKLGVQLYNENETTKMDTPLPCYLIRIFPSDDGLKEIMRSQEVEARPLEVVRNLIKESTREEDGVALLSLMQRAPNGRLALAQVIKTVFEGKKSTLLLLATDMVSETLAKSEKTLKRLKSREIDRDIFAAYHVEKLTQLGRRLADRVLEVGEKAARAEFNSALIQSIGDVPEIGKPALGGVSTTFFDRLWSIGKALASI